MRGEDLVTAIAALVGYGSPPHARGRHVGILRRARAGRITPACAGKTMGLGGGLVPPWDHPRMRGEDCRRAGEKRALQGSPPHARGRLGRARPRMGTLGITPACAGKTSTTTRAVFSVGDHPRMRGEDAAKSILNRLMSGSPPHARGRPSPAPKPIKAAGITPACAGKTAERKRPNLNKWDHPRMRGEDVSELEAGNALEWDHPRMRGEDS